MVAFYISALCDTALFIAAERGLEAAVLMLIEGNRHAQADVNARDFEGATPLIVAASRGHTKVAALPSCRSAASRPMKL